MKYELTKIKYKYDALEPFIDTRTMEIHHGKHHQTYVDKFNTIIKNYPELEEKTPEQLISEIHKVPEAIRVHIKNQGGGVVNHNFFFSILKKDSVPHGEILAEIEMTFESFEKFKEEFINSALSLFGSGWTWLILDDGKLRIMNTLNQDSPLSQGKIPLLVIDVWEHAYYLRYQNKRAEYVENFFNVINWEKVNEIFLESIKNEK